MPRISDPPWKIKTRPCPFYTRGNCFFADACNFIHTVKSPVAPEIRVTESNSLLMYDGYADVQSRGRVTPPNVVSPTLTDKSPSPRDGIVAPQPERDWSNVARRLSWASIHSIASAGSNLTYPTDPSPTASRVSTPGEEEHKGQSYFESEPVYDNVGLISSTTTMATAAASLTGLPFQRNHHRDSIVQPESLKRSSVFTQKTYTPADRPSPQIPDQSSLPPPLSSTTVSSKRSSPSEKEAQVVVVQTTGSLAKAFRLDPAQPRRSQRSRGHGTNDDAGGVVLPEAVDQSMPRRRNVEASSTHRSTLSRTSTEGGSQSSLHTVLLNLQTTAARLRRTDSIDNPISPETVAGSVASSSRTRPAPFQGDGDNKSEAFRKHLSSLISHRSAQIHRKPSEKPVFDLRALSEMLVHPSDALSSLPDVAEEPEVDGAANAFQRPKGPAKRRNRKIPIIAPSPVRVKSIDEIVASLTSLVTTPSPPVIPSSVTPPPVTPPPVTPPSVTSPLAISSPANSPLVIPTATPPPVIPSPVTPPPATPPPATPPPPSTPPSHVRVGSLTRTPLTDSPGDFRELPRTSFSPLEDVDAEASSGALGSYTSDVTPRRPTDLTTGASVTPIPKAAVGDKPPTPSPETKTTTDTDITDIVTPLMNMGSPKSSLRPLRLSQLFDKAQSTTPDRSPSSPFSIASLPKRKSRRPLSALFAAVADVAEVQVDVPLNVSADVTTSSRSSPNPPPNPSSNPSPVPQPLIPTKLPKTPSLLYTQAPASYPATNTPLSSKSDKLLPPSSSTTPQFITFPSRISHASDRSVGLGLETFSSPSLLSSQFTPDTPAGSAHDIQVPLPPSHQRQRSSISYVTRPSHTRAKSSYSSVRSAKSSASAASASSKSSVTKPLLFWALAADNVQEVERLLASGEASANDKAGPDDVPALLFAMGNESLKNKTEIVKTLLAYGADPSVLRTGAQNTPPITVPMSATAQPVSTKEKVDDADDRYKRESIVTIRPSPRSESIPAVQVAPPTRQLTITRNPEIEYFMSRAAELPPKQLEALRNAGFDPLTRMPFRMVGQDLVLQELLRVLARHSQRGDTSPVSIIFAGPSGHGKSLLSRSIGELLRVPAHTVNMTNLRTQDELLQSRSLATASSENVNLAGFLEMHEGKRCAVILEEIEKVGDKSAANTLLMPWELGKLNTPTRVYDTSKVIWISTSNAGEDIVFDFEQHRGDRQCTRNEYLDLATRIRRRLIESLGASLVSRITTVLPFLAFTDAEKLALAHQHLPPHTLSNTELDMLLDKIIQDYIPSEGVRSIQRAVERHYEEELW